MTGSFVTKNFSYGLICFNFQYELTNGYVFQVGDDPRDVKYWLRVFRYQEKELERPFAVVHVEDSVFQRADMV